MIDRKKGLYRQKIRKRAALLIGKLGAKTILVHNGLALGLRHLAQITEGPGDQPATVFRKTAILLRRGAKLLPLFRCKPFHYLGMLNHAAALLWRHVVELGEAVTHGLLRLRRKIAKTGFILKCALLFCRRKIAMSLHPLTKMLLLLLLSLSLTRCTYCRVPRLPCPVH